MYESQALASVMQGTVSRFRYEVPSHAIHTGAARLRNGPLADFFFFFFSFFSAALSLGVHFFLPPSDIVTWLGLRRLGKTVARVSLWPGGGAGAKSGRVLLLAC